VRTHYAYEVLSLRLPTSKVLDGNVAFLKVLLKAGYWEAQCIPRRYWKRSTYRDAILLVIARPVE